jgi:hypothetical protein
VDKPIHVASPADVGLAVGTCYSRADGLPPGTVTGYVDWVFPVLLAGIDPRAENELTGLGGAVTSGRYLIEGEQDTPNLGGLPGTGIPVIGSTNSFDGDTDDVTVSLLPSSAVTAARLSSTARTATALGAMRGTTVQRLTITGAQAWQNLLSSFANTDAAGGADPAAVPVTNGSSVWQDQLNFNGTQYLTPAVQPACRARSHPHDRHPRPGGRRAVR